ncbi:hypothetical protein H5410_060412 [Solanum commersonii]|uniref:Uncharacterized protein n=1 Tax=Solanum commersonii TaxID=4109 RepID=A0A9J5W6H0_SOLCO|nr:hypothetical protein H5410_060412 [Solanum commersonii]
MYYQCQLTVHLIKVKFPWIRTILTHMERMVKCNTNGVSKGNPGPSTYGLCLRDRNENLIYAEAQSIGIATMTIWKALLFA